MDTLRYTRSCDRFKEQKNKSNISGKENTGVSGPGETEVKFLLEGKVERMNQ